MSCKNLEHRSDSKFLELPEDQSGLGRHRCAGCAYDRGYEDGKQRKELLNINLDTLPNSQAGTVRHKSVHAAYALGFYEGVLDSYN
jgi:hypothetical protein